jgi:2-C-methyl-D-erythritol 2,4-cyclodiphosphate synthase
VIRVGQGFDVHPFDEARPLILAGVRISERGGLAGHSDADAVLHAVVDALLGAAGAGDIGVYFPSEDSKWKDADSRRFLAEARQLVISIGGEVSNLDVTIIAQQPKLAPHREAMRDSLAQLLGLPRDRVNIKATTTDHLGFIGRREGICAMAVVAVNVEPAR